MLNRSRLVTAIGIALAAVMLVSGCSSGKDAAGGDGSSRSGSGPAAAGSTPASTTAPSPQPETPAFNAATTGVVNASAKTGGTLNLLADGDCDSWDPANTYYAWCWNMQRLFTRTLVGYSATAGASNVAIQGDLATGLGEHNDDFTQWTYRLRDVKWENGTAVTAQQVKYGFERVFATDIFSQGPASYFLCLLDKCDATGNPSYHGPYRDRGGLSSITTPDDKTIVFALQASTPDFDHLMTLPAAAAVPLDEDGSFRGIKYTLHPLSDGPYKFASYTPEQKITWVRNPNWDSATDHIRKALVDTIRLTIDTDSAANDKRLQDGTADAIADGGVASAFRDAIDGSAALKRNADDPVSSYVRYFAVFPQTAPLDNVHCRRAIAYALNKADLVTARGGAYAAQVAHTMSQPTIPGHDGSADPYPGGTNDTGDLVKARSELTQCGKPDGFTITQAYVNSGRGPAVFTASQTALARVGITVTGATHAQSGYYGNYIGRPSTVKSLGIGMAQAGWGADYPAGDGYWRSIAAGNSPPGGGNYTQLKDSKVDDLLAQAARSTGPQDSVFKQLDAQVMSNAVMLPFTYDKTLQFRNPRLTNVRVNFALGAFYDFVNAGVSDGK